jgi:hypothetical protein
MTKEEMETDFMRYHAKLLQAKSALNEANYRKALQMAEESWQHVDGMMQYERKYNGVAACTIEAIDLALDYAPLLFDAGVLQRLAALLKAHRRIEKNTAEDLSDKLSKARELMWDAYRLWDQMEKRADASESVLAEHLEMAKRWLFVRDAWQKMEVIVRLKKDGSHQLTFRTQLDAAAVGKCPVCGAIAKAKKAKFLEKQACPKCQGKVLFVILSREPSTPKP